MDLIKKIPTSGKECDLYVASSIFICFKVAKMSLFSLPPSFLIHAAVFT